MSAAPPALELIDNAEVFDQSPADQFQCIADYMGVVSKENGMGELWSHTEPILKRHINDWKSCSQVSNKVLFILYVRNNAIALRLLLVYSFLTNPTIALNIFRCNLKNGFQTFRTFADYVKLAGAQNPTMFIKFIRGLPKYCQNQALAEHFEDFL